MSGPAADRPTIRQAEQVAIGEQLPERTLRIDRARLVAYAGASLDRNPIHWDERFARSVGLPDVIAHGMFTMAAAAVLVTDWVGDAGRVVSYSSKFPKPVVVPYDGGASVQVGGRVTALDTQTRRATVEISALSGTDKVLGRALIVVQLD